MHGDKRLHAVIGCGQSHWVEQVWLVDWLARVNKKAPEYFYAEAVCAIVLARVFGFKGIAATHAILFLLSVIPVACNL
jgi:hypothetical protein